MAVHVFYNQCMSILPNKMDLKQTQIPIKIVHTHILGVPNVLYWTSTLHEGSPIAMVQFQYHWFKDKIQGGIEQRM